MRKTIKFFFTRVYTITSIVLFALSYGAIQAYAVYYPTDNITNPTCAPGDSGCYVSLLPSQTSNAGKLLYTDGTNPSWVSGVNINTSTGLFTADNMLRVGTIAPSVYSSVRPGFAVYDQNNVNVEGYLSVFHSAANSSVGVVHRYLNQRGTDPASPSPYLAGDYAYREQVSTYGTDSAFLPSYSIRDIQYITDSTTGNPPNILHNIRSGSQNANTSISLLPSGATIGNANAVTYTSTALARLAVIGSGTTSSTYTAQFQNSTGTNNSLTIRDDGSIGVGTSTPSFQFHMVGSAPNLTLQRYSDSTTPPVFRGWKSRGTTSVPTAVLSGDGLASFIGGGYDGSGSFDTASIQMVAQENFTGSSNRGTYISFNTNPVGSTASSGGYERMRISANGNVGIGTTTPFGKLDIAGSSSSTDLVAFDTNRSISVINTNTTTNNAQGIALRSYGTDGTTIQSGVKLLAVNTARTATTITSDFAILTNNAGTVSEKMRVRANGNVSIGNTNSTYRLEVGSSGVSGIVSRFVNSTGTCDINPTTTSLSCSSDINLKKNITTLKDNQSFVLNTQTPDTSVLKNLNKITPVIYNWTTEQDIDTKHPGFIAQDVEQIFPSLVSTDPTTNLKSLNYIGLIPYAIEGIRELDIKVNQLSSLDTTLQGSFAFLLKEVLGNVSNGINELYVKVVKSDRVETKELCTTDGICLSENDIKNLYQISQERNQTNPQLAPQNPPAPENSPVEELPPQENVEEIVE